MKNGELQKTSNTWQDLLSDHGCHYALIDLKEKDEFGYEFDRCPVMISICESRWESGKGDVWAKFCVPTLNNMILHSGDYGKTWNVRIIREIVVDGEDTILEFDSLGFDENLNVV